MKPNQLSKMWYSRHGNLNDFLELHENKPEMAVLGVELIIGFCDFIFSLKSLSLFQGFPAVCGLADVQN